MNSCKCKSTEADSLKHDVLQEHLCRLLLNFGDWMAVELGFNKIYCSS